MPSRCALSEGRGEEWVEWGSDERGRMGRAIMLTAVARDYERAKH